MSDQAVLRDPLSPPFDTKVAIAVRDDLVPWQQLNVTAFLSAGIAAAHPHLVGQRYADRDATPYLALLGIPVLVFEASGEVLTSARDRAVPRGIPLAVYTREMFATGYDAANRPAVAAVLSAELDLVGLALHGPKNAVDKVITSARLHP